MGGWNRNRSGDVDRLRLGILALAWLFTRALRRCVSWKLLSSFRARSFRASLSHCLAVISGWNGDGFLLFRTGGSDFSAGGDQNFSEFLLQAIGVIVLRIRRPDLPRQFRVWLYPVPALVAIAGFIFIL